MRAKVQVRTEIVTVWSFTVDEFVETYRDEWEHDGRPDPDEWVRESIEALGSDQLDRVSPGSVVRDEIDVRVS